MANVLAAEKVEAVMRLPRMRWAVFVCVVLLGALASFTLQAGAASAVTRFNFGPQATVTCNQAIARNSIVGHKILATCGRGYILGRQACTKSGEVDWLTGPANVTVLLKVGKRPQGYAEGKFYMSTISRLCGDPIDPTLTPPPAPMSTARLRHFFSNP
jgi:hypothetical protein